MDDLAIWALLKVLYLALVILIFMSMSKLHSFC